MAKRAHSVAFDVNESEKKRVSKKEGKKHSLDSDEEDSGAEEERNNVLDADDIEGEEDGAGGMDNEITITPFNMKEELQEGHFDTQGHYHWKKEKEIRDSWLDNIDWVKVTGRPEDKYKVHKERDNKGLGDESSSDEDENESQFDLIDNYKRILKHMQPGETIGKSLQRLGANSKVSSAERWRRKKAGIVDEGGKIVTEVTELANQILTKTGNMDIYQETYNKVLSIVNKSNKNDGALDMYADDFDVKEQINMGKGHGSTSEVTDEDESKGLKWEFKWSQNDSAEITGPHTTEQMHKWATEGHFKTGVWVRKHGEDSQFYSSNRMDFELYI